MLALFTVYDRPADTPVLQLYPVPVIFVVVNCAVIVCVPAVNATVEITNCDGEAKADTVTESKNTPPSKNAVKPVAAAPADVTVTETYTV